MFKRLSRKIIWFNFVMLCVTGVLLYTCIPATPDELPHPNSHMWRQFHALFSFIGMLNFGYILGEHIKRKWHRWRNHMEGLLHAMNWAVLIISGYLLYYPQSYLDSWMNMSEIHWYAGLSLILLLPFHILLRMPQKLIGKPSRKKARIKTYS